MRSGSPTATASSSEARTGLSFSVIEPIVSEQARRGLLAVAGSRISPTEFGWRFLNDLQLGYLPRTRSGAGSTASRGRNLGWETAHTAAAGGGVLHNRGAAAEN